MLALMDPDCSARVDIGVAVGERVDLPGYGERRHRPPVVGREALARIAMNFNGPGSSITLLSLPGIGPICELKEVQTRYGTPRTVAGEGVETDTNKCALKPLRRLDYYPISFTDDQWQRLQGAFPGGVCDWSKPGAAMQRSTPWRTFAKGPGGAPMEAAPRSKRI